MFFNAVYFCLDERVHSSSVLSVVRPLNRQFAERLKSVFLQTMQNPGGDGSTTQKKSSAELAEKISGLWVNAKLFEKGFKLFDGTSQSCFFGFMW